MGSIIQKLADEIELHGSYEKYCAWRDIETIKGKKAASFVSEKIGLRLECAIKRVTDEKKS